MYPAYASVDSYPFHLNPMLLRLNDTQPKTVNYPYHYYPVPPNFPNPMLLRLNDTDPETVNHPYHYYPVPPNFPNPMLLRLNDTDPETVRTVNYPFHYYPVPPNYFVGPYPHYPPPPPFPTPYHSAPYDYDKKSRIEPEIDQKMNDFFDPKDYSYPVSLKPRESSFPIIWLPSKNGKDGLERETCDENRRQVENGITNKDSTPKVIPVTKPKHDSVKKTGNRVEDETPLKTSKLPQVCLRVDPLPKNKNGLNGSRSTVENREGVKRSIKIVNVVNDVNDVAREIKVEKVKKMTEKITENEAALIIQSVYRGFQVRKSEPLMKLKQIAEVKKQVNEVKDRVQNLDVSSFSIDKQKLVIGETIMSLLLKLDSVQGLHPVIRDVRKSVVKELVGLEERLDSLTFVNPNAEKPDQDRAQLSENGEVELTECCDSVQGLHPVVRDVRLEEKLDSSTFVNPNTEEPNQDRARLLENREVELTELTELTECCEFEAKEGRKVDDIENENERLKEMVEELTRVGNEQLGVITELTGKVRDLERKLSKKTKTKTKKTKSKSKKGRFRGFVVQDE